jgi:hypothetical protein
MSPDGKRDKTHETGATHEVWGVQARRRQILRDETYIEVGRRTKDDPPADGGGQMSLFRALLYPECPSCRSTALPALVELMLRMISDNARMPGAAKHRPTV